MNFHDKKEELLRTQQQQPYHWSSSLLITAMFYFLIMGVENLGKEKVQGHIIRSRAKCVKEGGKPTKYFCKLETRTFKIKH